MNNDNINNEYYERWERYYNSHKDGDMNSDELLAAFRKAMDSTNFIPPINKDDLFMEGANGEYMGGPRPHGADGEWVENLTEEDVGEHGEWLGITNTLYGPIQKFMIFRDTMIERFIKTFGETE